jgi:hypothetical protein
LKKAKSWGWRSASSAAATTASGRASFDLESEEYRVERRLLLGPLLLLLLSSLGEAGEEEAAAAAGVESRNEDVTGRRGGGRASIDCSVDLVLAPWGPLPEKNGIRRRSLLEVNAEAVVEEGRTALLARGRRAEASRKRGGMLGRKRVREWEKEIFPLPLSLTFFSFFEGSKEASNRFCRFSFSSRNSLLPFFSFLFLAPDLFFFPPFSPP